MKVGLRGKWGGEEEDDWEEWGGGKGGRESWQCLVRNKQEREDITMRAIIILKEESEQTGQA